MPTFTRYYPVCQLTEQIDTHHRNQFAPTNTRTNDFSGTKTRTAGSTSTNALERFASKSGRCFVMNINTDDRHRQPAFMRPGGAVLLSTKSWLCVLLSISWGRCVSTTSWL